MPPIYVPCAALDFDTGGAKVRTQTTGRLVPVPPNLKLFGAKLYAVGKEVERDRDHIRVLFTNSRSAWVKKRAVLTTEAKPKSKPAKNRKRG